MDHRSTLCIKLSKETENINFYNNIDIPIDIIDEKYRKRQYDLKGETYVTVDPGSYLVRAHLPSGEDVVASSTVAAGQVATVVLTPSKSVHEWLAWPYFLGEVAGGEEQEDNEQSLAKETHLSWREFSDLLPRVRLWSTHYASNAKTWSDFIREGTPEDRAYTWKPERQQLTQIDHNWTAGLEDWMIDPDIETASFVLNMRPYPFGLHMLQLEWDNHERFVFLPPTPGKVQVVITINAVHLPSKSSTRDFTTHVVSMDQYAEMLLHYLKIGDFQSAGASLKKTLPSASCLMQFDSNLSDDLTIMDAVSSGYYLLRMQHLDDSAELLNWAKEFADKIWWLPDSQVIYGCGLLRSARDELLPLVRQAFLEAVTRGIPLYSEGLRLLIDGLGLLVYRMNEKDDITTALEFLYSYTAKINWNQQLTTLNNINLQTLQTRFRLPVLV